MNNISRTSQRKRQLRDPSHAVVNTTSSRSSNGNAAAATKNKKKRKTPGYDDTDDNSSSITNCSFCLQVPAALTVDLPVLRHRNKRAATPYCLTCYYTTSVVRYDTTKYIHIFDQSQLDAQLPPMQQLFGDVYLELQKEISEEAARSFQRQRKDPLAALLGGGGGGNNKKKKSISLLPSNKKRTAGNAADGGFLRSVPVPDRLLQTQRQQARLHEAQMQRMNRATAAAAAAAESTVVTAESQVYKRRKSSGKSIWNLAMAPKSALEKAATNDFNDNQGAITLSSSSSTAMIQSNNEQYVMSVCSCGSKDVQNIGNMTSRNQDMSKGETWGMKDRGNDVVSRYQCNKCGKIWNEEE